MSLNYFDYPVLYVDDEPANVSNLSYALEDHFTVLTATRGQDAVRMLSEQDVAVLMADFKMPEMDGAELCARARSIRPDAVRMIVTAYPDLHVAMSAINRGQVSQFIAKPFDDAELIATVRDAIDLVHMQRSFRSLELRVLRSNAEAAGSRVTSGLAQVMAEKIAALRTCMREIADLTEVALKPGVTSDRVRELLASAERNHQIAVELLEEIGDLVERLGKGVRNRVMPAPRCEVARAVAATVRTLRRDIGRRIGLHLHIDDEPTVAMEPGDLGQALTNLLSEAAAVGGMGATASQLTVRVKRDGDEAIVSIWDNLRCIPKEDLPRVFDPYSSGSRGLGLAVARDLISRAGGTIAVESTPRAGTTFMIRMPTKTP